MTSENDGAHTPDSPSTVARYRALARLAWRHGRSDLLAGSDAEGGDVAFGEEPALGDEDKAEQFARYL